MDNYNFSRILSCLNKERIIPYQKNESSKLVVINKNKNCFQHLSYVPLINTIMKRNVNSISVYKTVEILLLIYFILFVP